MGFVTIKDQDGVEHTIHASQLQAPNQTLTVTYGCSECDKLRADLAAAQMELAAYKRAVAELGGTRTGRREVEWVGRRVSELLAQEGVPAQPQYREPTIEDARELVDSYILAKGIKLNTCMLNALKQLGFVRKVQP